MPDPFAGQLMAHVPQMRAYATLLHRSQTDADDLVQEVLLRAWRYRHTFALGTNLKAWLFRILRNEFLSQMRRRPTTTRVTEQPEASMAFDTSEQEWRRQYARMLEALGKLPESGREALLLVVASGCSYEEAAEICGCAVGTIKSRVSRARAVLADLIGYEEPVRRRATHLAGAGHASAA